MRGMTDAMTSGERVAFYRRRRGLPQTVVAGLVGRTADWLRKVEHNALPLDRLSVLRQLATVLSVSLGDLIGEPVLWESSNPPSGGVPAIRLALMDHRQFLTAVRRDPPVQSNWLASETAAGWNDYQYSRYTRLAQRLPQLITDARSACRQHGQSSDEGLHAHELAASIHQLAAAFLTKLGEADLAAFSATTGLDDAKICGNPLTIASLHRSVAHTLLSIGAFEESTALVRSAVDLFEPELGTATPEYLSVYGMLHLVGASAASRREDRGDTAEFLAGADEAATRLGRDANYLWTAFGPTNVAIHRVTAAMELGDVQVAADLGQRVDTSALPVERRVRHTIETARALARWNRDEDALTLLLEAERKAPDQVRYHRLSRTVVREMARAPRPLSGVIDLAERMGVRGGEPAES